MIPESSETECFSDVVDSIGMASTIEHLLSRQICFDIINMNKLQGYEIKNGYIITPYNEMVNKFVMPNISYLSEETILLLNEFNNYGVDIYFMGENRVINGLNFTPKFLSDSEIVSSDLSLNTFNQYINVLHKSFDEGEIYFIANTIDNDQEISVNLPFTNKNVAIYDPYDLCLTNINPMVNDDKIKFNLEISSNKAKMILVY